jgi:hypothetical protein
MTRIDIRQFVLKHWMDFALIYVRLYPGTALIFLFLGIAGLIGATWVGNLPD